MADEETGRAAEIAVRYQTRKQLLVDASLTDWEWRGLHESFNVADGHAHYRLPESLARHLKSIPDIFSSIDELSQAEYEHRFVEAFFALAGQSIPHRPPHLHYSSSTTIDLAAKTLQAAGVRSVGILTPTFDNIPQLLLRAGLNLVPIEEAVAGDLERLLKAVQSLDALVLVLPNNPTGWVPSSELLLGLLEAAARTGQIVVVDFSFRFFSGRMAKVDLYKIADGLDDLKWIFIEDTGKTWATSELKTGFASCSSHLDPMMTLVSGELLLNVSPVILELLSRMIQTESVGTDRVWAASLATENRAQIRAALGSVPGLRFPCIASEISLEWLALPAPKATEACNFLNGRGVSVLPGGPFFWNDRSLGEGFVRVALARSPDYVRSASEALAAGLTEFFVRDNDSSPVDPQLDQ